MEPGQLDALALGPWPPVVLRADIVRESPVATGDNLPLAGQARLASWSAVPSLLPGTRTCWTPLPGGRAMKLKGVGYREEGGSARPPADVPFHRPNPHLGIQDDGELTIVPSSSAPLGGLLLKRAEMEHEVASRLAEASVPAVRPLRVYRYRGVSYSGGGALTPEAMGAVLTLAPAAEPHRADLLTRNPDKLADDELERLERLIGASEVDGEQRRIELISLLAQTYGAALRGFALSGFFRHSGSLDNWALADSGDRVYLTDLDSSQPLADCTEERAPLEVMRDVASGLFNIAAALMNPDVALLISPATVKRADPFEAFLRGYHQELPQARVRAGAERFRRHWMPLLAEQRHQLGAAAHGRKLVRVWMNRRAASGVALAIAYDLYKRSDLSEIYGLPFSGEEFRERIARFLSDTDDPKPRDDTDRNGTSEHQSLQHPGA